MLVSPNTIESPTMSPYFKSLSGDSAIRRAGAAYNERPDRKEVSSVDVSLGSVSEPMHPVLYDAMGNLCTKGGPFENGSVRYTETAGILTAREAIFKLMQANGCNTEGLYCNITDGSSYGMMLSMRGVCNEPGSKDRPLLTFDPLYTNYKNVANFLNLPMVSINRELQENGKFTVPEPGDVAKVIQEVRPAALLLVNPDNPSGQFMPQAAQFASQGSVDKYAQICAENGIWIIEDGAYRGMHPDLPPASIFNLPPEIASLIFGKRISLESFSKIFNGCGLHMGGLVTDSKEFHTKAVAAHSGIGLCSNAIGQNIIAALANPNVAIEDIQAWIVQLNNHYNDVMTMVVDGLGQTMPEAIVSNPEGAIYSVIDVRNIAEPGFDAEEFMLYCASKGTVEIEGVGKKTLLFAPMADFYNVEEGQPNPGVTQMRIAHVLPPEEMALVPELFAKLFRDYEAQR